ncbi:hypothetical protein RVR34_21800 [Microcystis aeruginosa FBCC-A68]|uniref:hypothetical protein n=1 Tax=Microcystis aeruginosa TaxID=1126 RepID=UPI0014838938|nr:hypothetical protein [Microcystis aeruginosa]
MTAHLENFSTNARTSSPRCQLRHCLNGVGCRVWGVGFYRLSGGQLANFQGKIP